MKIGLIPVNIGVASVEMMVDLAVLTEELGFEQKPVSRKPDYG